MSWLSFIAGMFVGVIFGATIMACCNLSGRADRITQEAMDRMDRAGRVDS